MCDNCKLKSYEVTTSEYTKSVGAIVEDWSEEYSLLNGGVTDEIADALVCSLRAFLMYWILPIYLFLLSSGFTSLAVISKVTES